MSNSSKIVAKADARRVKLCLFEKLGLKNRFAIGLSLHIRHKYPSLPWFVHRFACTLTYGDRGGLCTLTETNINLKMKDLSRRMHKKQAGSVPSVAGCLWNDSVLEIFVAVHQQIPRSQGVKPRMTICP